MIGNDNTAELVLFQNSHHSQHVQVAVVDKRFFIKRNFAAYISKVNIGDSTLAAVVIHGIVDAAFRHFGKRSNTTFKLIRRALDLCRSGLGRNEAGIRGEPARARSATAGRRDERQASHPPPPLWEDSRPGNRSSFPQLLVGGLRHNARSRVGVINHVPHHAVGNRIVNRAAIPTLIAPPRENGPVTRPATPATLKL